MKKTPHTASCLAVIIFIFFFISNGYAAYYIPDINSSASPKPGTEHFYWINNANSGNGLAYTTASDSVNVVFNLYAPDNWDATYSGLRVKDQSFSGLTWESGGGSGSFDDVYAYFYQVDNTQTNTERLKNFSVYFSPAAIEGYGYTGDGGTVALDTVETDGPTFVASWPHPELQDGAKSNWFFVTSKYWWGWQTLELDGSAASGSTLLDTGGSYSPQGKIPAPNPEAPVVALYLVGLGGVVAVFRHRRRSSAVT